MGVVKEVQRDFPLVGVWGYPPAFKVPQAWGIEGVDDNVQIDR